MSLTVDGVRAAQTQWTGAAERASQPKSSSPEGTECAAAPAPRYDEFVRSQPPREEPEEAGGTDEKPEIKKCTVDTDKVEAEIKKLKEERRALQEQLRQAADDPQKQRQLETQLAAIEAELKAKDNDAYKKQHATYTYSD